MDGLSVVSRQPMCGLRNQQRLARLKNVEPLKICCFWQKLSGANHFRSNFLTFERVCDALKTRYPTVVLI
jgi:hypothetical protein